MVIDPWLPFGYVLPDGSNTRMALYEGIDWQIMQTDGSGRVLVIDEDLVARWTEARIIETDAFQRFRFGARALCCVTTGQGQTLIPVADAKAPASLNEALAFALALKATREIDREVSLHDAIYLERYSRLLPTYSLSPRADDELVLGRWLTGGASISVRSFRRLHQVLNWLREEHLRRVLTSAGFEDVELDVSPVDTNDALSGKRTSRLFELPGRPELAAFFNDHVIDVVQHRDRYKALGIEFPSAVVLYGPPGTGKTFAIERLVDFLGWPNFSIDASSVASPYIHETSRKVAEVFEKAINNAPSVLVIDEMEAFLADREMGSGHHRVEEVAEFLRRIPEATQNEVLIVGMTNRIDMIDPAVLRRGRFDHVLKVDYAQSEEVHALLSKLLSTVPVLENINLEEYAQELADRPLSDVAFVVREAGRFAARAGKNHIDNEDLSAAVAASPKRRPEGDTQRRIGFM